jgi:hypothetical protein
MIFYTELINSYNIIILSVIDTINIIIVDVKYI